MRRRCFYRRLCSVYAALSDAGISPVVVKGIVCRALYPKPDLRSSADEDLYIPLGQYPAFHEKMLELGFQAGAPDYKNSHEARYTRNGLLIEGHWELFPRDSSALNALNRYNAGFFARAQVRHIEGARLLSLDDTDHMSFLLLHAYKHFINSGVGLRQICDIALWAQAYDIDWQRVKDTMSAIGASISPRRSSTPPKNTAALVSPASGRRPTAQRLSRTPFPEASTARRT